MRNSISTFWWRHFRLCNEKSLLITTTGEATDNINFAKSWLSNNKKNFVALSFVSLQNVLFRPRTFYQWNFEALFRRDIQNKKHKVSLTSWHCSLLEMIIIARGLKKKRWAEWGVGIIDTPIIKQTGKVLRGNLCSRKCERLIGQHVSVFDSIIGDLLIWKAVPCRHGFSTKIFRREPWTFVIENLSSQITFSNPELQAFVTTGLQPTSQLFRLKFSYMWLTVKWFHWDARWWKNRHENSLKTWTNLKGFANKVSVF